jgi:predicted dehydrogenase
MLLLPFRPDDDCGTHSGAHLIDQALVLFGLPDAVTAHLLNQRHLPATTVSGKDGSATRFVLPTSHPPTPSSVQAAVFPPCNSLHLIPLLV